MSPADLAARYRLHAADSVKIANEVRDEHEKLSLLAMAQAWIALAEQAERNGETALFYETPVTPTRPEKR
jgi:hypothetical protein